jgi:hypothetical protein
MASQLIFTENITSPDTPSTGKLKLYAKDDGFLYFKNASGTEVQISATSAITSLTGDVTATGPGASAATVVSVGGASAASVASTVTTVAAATASNTPSTLVLRDSSGNFSAGTITANLTGTATNFSGSLSGEVTGTQSTTVLSNSAVISKVLTGFSSGAGTVSATDSLLVAIGKLDGNDGLRALKTGDTFTGTVVMDNQSAIRFREDSANGTEFVGIRAPDALAASYSVKLPNVQASGALTNDGSGNLSWAAASLAGFTTDDLAEGTTNLYFTDERAQDAVGNILSDSAKIDLTYSDVGNFISATIVPNSLVNNDIATGAAIDFDKMETLPTNRALISNGTGVISVSTVTEDELSHVAGVTSPIQTQLDGKQPLDSDLTALSGLTTLGFIVRDGSGSATTRTLQTGTGINISNPAGILGDPSISVTLSPFSTSDLAEGTNLYFTDERAQDAVGNMLTDSSNIEFTYNDLSDTITANVIALSLTDAEISATAAIAGTKISPNFGSQNVTTTGSVTGNTLLSSSYLELPEIAAPSTPTNALRLFVDTSNRLSLKGESGFVSTLDDSANTADRVYTLPNASGTLGLQTTSQSVSSNVSLTDGLATLVVYVDTTAARSITLPNPANNANRRIIIKDISGLCETNNITMVRFGSEQIEGLAASRVLSANYGSWSFISNGTNWWII